MKCPVCNVDLVMSERQGVEIDYCPKCRGVWLDRGELDKIIERTMDGTPGRAAPPAGSSQAYPDGDDDDDSSQQYGRKKSWLGELFG